MMPLLQLKLTIKLTLISYLGQAFIECDHIWQKFASLNKIFQEFMLYLVKFWLFLCQFLGHLANFHNRKSQNLVWDKFLTHWAKFVIYHVVTLLSGCHKEQEICIYMLKIAFSKTVSTERPGFAYISFNPLENMLTK